MNFLFLARDELKKLLSNRFTRLALVVVCGIPLLYSFLYLYAFWDPYGKLDKLPVAVVNNDNGAIFEGKNYNFGGQLVDTLRQNHAADWRFVTSGDARYGLDHKKYYMAVSVPADFSNKILSVNSSRPEPARLDFIVNQGSNYLASQIGSRIITEVKNNLANRISQNFVNNIFSQIRTTSDGLTQAGDGANRLSIGIDSVLAGNRNLTGGLARTAEANREVASGTAKMSKGSGELYNGLRKSAAAADLMAAKTGEARDGLDQISSGLAAARDGSALLAGKLSEAAVGEANVQQGLVSAGSGARKLSDGAIQLGGGVRQVSDGIGSVTVGLNKLAGSVQDGASQLQQANLQLVSGTQSLSGILNQYRAGIDTSASGLKASQLALQKAEGSLKAYLSKHPEAANDPDLALTLGTLQKTGGPDELGAVSAGLDQGRTVLTSQIIPAVDRINSGQQKLGAGIDEMAVRVNLALKGDGSSQPAAIPALAALKSGLTSHIQPGLSKLSEQSGKLAGGIDTLAEGAGKLQDGLITAAQKLNQLEAGSSQMKAGNETLANGIQQLAENLRTMGLAQNKMAAGAGQLNNGLQKSSGGLSTINKGLTAVENGQNQLGSGLQKLKTGAGNLAGKLQSAAQQARNQTAPDVTEKKSAIIASPVALEEKPMHKVDLYGSGFAPYFIPLSLWVGALMIFFVINAKSGQRRDGSKFQQALGKYFTVAAISTCQALVTGFVIRNVLHLAVTNALQFYLFNILLSLVFVAIIHFFVSAFGIAGRFVALVLLMLQLTSAGGTFPVELVPRFFQVLNPILPMSYGVSGLREIISGANSSLLPVNTVVLTAFGLVFLGLTVFSYISPFFAKLNLPDEVTSAA